MQAWIGLAGVLVGGATTVLGQYFLRAVARRDELTIAIAEQFAQVVALSEDFRNRLWEERVLGLADQVAQWPIGEYRLAAARLAITCPDPRVQEALRDLQEAGSALGRAWRQPSRDDDLVESAWHEHRAALDAAVACGGEAVRAARVRSRLDPFRIGTGDARPGAAGPKPPAVG